MSSLLEPIVVGSKLTLRNRVVMGSMTRNRCFDDCKPGEAQVRHYADRARDGTGLIVNEGTFIDWTGCDWKYSPFMITEDHAIAWRKVTDAVHQAGGKIFFQAWHAGRCQHDQMPIMKEHNGRVLAPSAIKANDGKYRDLPGQPGHTANIEAIKDVSEVIQLYRRSCQLAKNAGFDGVELLAQGGYLPQQFLNSRANKRTDEYGGSVENRCRFILEVVGAIAEVFDGPEFVCVKINPTDFYNDSMVQFSEMKEVYTYLIRELVARKVGIINLGRRGIDPNAGTGDFFGRVKRPAGYPIPDGYDPVLDFGKLVKFPGSPTMLMANHDYTVEEADSLIKAGKLDLITFGRPFIYNPDVITRIKHSIPFNTNDRGPTVHYGPVQVADENYNDWPSARI
ncbi:nadh:flavin oxidoreductase nadh oxidase [Colletotrichum truncatum]|uniref:Nadh:flavin oxidoreductase nadh oxidase n=1 Tax=Colletotrichum truncatum TaxID=5467 RepID=A0ACC3YD48_COLTU|nr:nadh:flavin oxidoreductase nadh oxidase [Colletotrichum truncatum]KAF6784788.1 nadh:flavin oxidoreductase nadh oxidase [Colletotrichum truncatum]